MSIIKKSIQQAQAANERYQKKHTNPLLKRLAQEATAEIVRDLERLKTDFVNNKN